MYWNIFTHSKHCSFVDNWDAGTIERWETLYNDDPIELEEWQAGVAEGYLAWGVPRSLDKSTFGLEGQTLGASIQGVRGCAALGDEKSLDFFRGSYSMSVHLK